MFYACEWCPHVFASHSVDVLHCTCLSALSRCSNSVLVGRHLVLCLGFLRHFNIHSDKLLHFALNSHRSQAFKVCMWLLCIQYAFFGALVAHVTYTLIYRPIIGKIETHRDQSSREDTNTAACGLAAWWYRHIIPRCPCSTP